MARARNPNRDRAYELYKEHKSKITSKEIASMLDEKERNISYWRVQDKWSEKYNPNGGPPKGNKNAIGNDGGAPHENQNNRKHGFLSKYFPATTYNAFTDIENMTPLEILWTNIKVKFAAIITAQKIMYVEDKDDMTKELKKKKPGKFGDEKEYEIQFAWDKQANFLRAQSTAMGQLTNMIKKYDDMIHANWDLATEEQKLRIEKLKVQLDDPAFNKQHALAQEKHKLAKRRFKHQKDIDSKRYW